MRTNLRGFFGCLAALLVTPLFAGPGIGPSAVVVSPSTTGPTNADTISFNVRFDLPVNNFSDAADLIITHTGTANTTVTITNLSLFQDYNVDIEGITGDGTFTLAVNTGSDVTSLILLPMVSSVTSAPVSIDNTAPFITDPTDSGPFSPLGTIPFSWALAPTDTGSGIDNYFIEVGSAPNLNDYGSFDVTGQLSYNAGPFAHLDTVYARLGARDTAGNIGFSASTDGITVDLVFPTIGDPFDDGLFINSGSVQFSWATPADADSGINNTFIEIGTAPNANDLGVVVVTGTDVYTYTGATHGQTVYARVATRDNAGNQTFSASSDGVTIDLVDPVIFDPTDLGAYSGANVTLNWTLPTDALSGIDYARLRVGNAPGLSNLGIFDVTGLSTFDVPGVPNGTTLYARLEVSDNAENIVFSNITDGIAVDALPPTVFDPTDDGDFTNSGDVVFNWSLPTDADSGINNSFIELGTAPGLNDLGNIVVTGLTTYTLTGQPHGTTVYATIAARDNAGNIAFSGSSDGITVDLLAPTVFDPTDPGIYSQSSTVTFNFAAPTDALSGVASTFLIAESALGLGDFGVFDVTGLTTFDVPGLPDSAMVYARIESTDFAGNTSSSGSSDGIFIDTIFPTIYDPTDIGAFTNLTDVTFTWTLPEDLESGINNTFIELGTAPNLNDRGTVVVTGLTTHTIFGLIHDDVVFARLATRDNAGNQIFSASSDGIQVDTVQPSVGTPIDTGATITASAVPFTWTAATDIGSGIDTLLLEAGSSLGGNDLGTFDVTGLTNFDVPILADGNVYARLIATDLAGNVRTTISSDGIFATLPDTTPPTVAPVSDEGDYQVSTTFRFFWNNALITDTESGVDTVNLHVGTFPGGTDAGIFNVTGLNEYFFAGSPNIVYFARLRVTDVAGNSALGGISDGIAADTAPPIGSAPVDAGLYSTSTNVVFNWATPVDNISGVNVVFLQVGLFPGGNTVFNGDVTGLNTQAVAAVEGQTLYARLVMVDGLGNVGFTGPSDGITVDSTGPLALAPTDTDDYELTLATTFNWFTPTDLISGVLDTRLQVGTAPGLSDVFNAIVTGNTQTVAISEGQTLYARLVVRDNAGNTTISANSDGIIRDTIPPTIIGPFDTGDFTSSPNILFTWTTIEDLISGLADVQLQVGSAPGAADLFNGPITGNSQAIFGVASGTTAYARIIATDNAGNTRISNSTNGITIDNVSPSAVFTNVSDPTFLYHTDFVFLLTASEPLDLLPQDLNLVGDVPGIIQIIPTANPYEFNVRVVLNLPTVEGSFAVVLNAGATDIAGNPIVQPAVSDVIPVLVPINSSEENWMMHQY